MRTWLFSLLNKVTRPFYGRGISRKLPLIEKVYGSVYRRTAPEGIVLTEVQGLKIFAEGKSNMTQQLVTKDSYEEETTKLFHELLREGMTVLDLGANIGYLSLIAGRRVGEKGKVFAFEPWQESFSILRRNIEANGFNNIIAIETAVSNRCGRQRLFLSGDPVGHSLHEHAGKDSVEVDVTSIDEFVRQQNVSVDLIKMDVEGSEMDVLEGMAETIVKNPSMKIISEFRPDFLESSGRSPATFLETLMDYGFKLYLINDERHRREPITRNNMDGMIRTARRGGCNIYCDRAAEQVSATLPRSA